jgi:hypothetical protein
VRIPTKSIDNLKKISLIILVQTLENINSSDKKLIKFKRASENLHNMKFKTEFIAFMPIFDKRTQMVVENDRDHSLEIGYLKISPGRQLPTIPEDLNKIVSRTGGRIIV